MAQILSVRPTIADLDLEVSTLHAAYCQFLWLWAAVAESPVGTGILPGPSASFSIHSRDLMHTCGKAAFDYHSRNYSKCAARHLMS